MPSDFLESREWLELRYRVPEEAKRVVSALTVKKGRPENPIQVDHIKSRSAHPGTRASPKAIFKDSVSRLQSRQEQ